MRITPSARILSVLGDIEFDEWQCVAEFVDNAFDDFAAIHRANLDWDEDFRVEIALPSIGSYKDDQISVADNGRGMTRPSLEQAVRAGWSGNDQYSKLGLFGMGFNIASARLGRKTTVLTTRAGDSSWSGVEIDLDLIQDDFEVPDFDVEKEEPHLHGTRVIVERLDPDRARWLANNPEALRKALGTVYSYLLDVQGYSLFVDGVAVEPRRHCVWSEGRSVTYGSGARTEQIAAVQRINRVLPQAEVCENCGHWQAPSREACEVCNSRALTLRDRRLHGWIGIQRFLHKANYGIDFIRNGRKILQNDKRLFSWRNPHDPLSAEEIEYPTELGQGGRIIGEIHLDYVPVNYQKNAFEWSDRSWLSAVEYLRGPGPILPQKAAALGYGDNESALGVLHKGYRRNDPGYRYLIPGNGKGPIHDETRRWGERFFAGDSEFQSDEHWWNAVVAHEQIKAAKNKAGEKGSGQSKLTGTEVDLLKVLGIDIPAPAPGDEQGKGTDQQPKSEQERVEALIAVGTPLPELSGEFGLSEYGMSANVKTYLVDAWEIRNGQEQPVPSWLVGFGAGGTTVIIALRHPLITEFGLDPAELVLLELAQQFKIRAKLDLPVTALFAQLLIRCAPSLRLDDSTLRAQARELLGRIREGMQGAISDNPARAWQFLTADERVATENAIIAEGVSVPAKLKEDEVFIAYIPSLALARIVEEWPEAFMDRRVFAGPYHTLAESAARRFSVARVLDYLNDIARLDSSQGRLPPGQLARVRLSIQLLSQEIAE